MLIRPLAADDAAAALAVIHRAFAAQPIETDPPSAALREDAASIGAAIEEGGGASATADGVMVGVVLWSEKEGGLYFGRLSVDPAWRGNGIARQLVAAVEQEARRRGLTWVHLNARLPLIDNRRFFATCGYRETELRAHAGYSAPTSVVMEKRLTLAS